LIVKDVDRAATHLRVITGSLWAVDAVIGIHDTFEAYKEGKNWVKEAIKTSADLMLPEAASFVTDLSFLALGFTPVGWTAIIGVAAVEAGEVVVSEHFLNRYIEKSGV